MRRYLMWLAGSVGAFGVATLVLVLAFGRPGVRYEFLAGRERLSIPPQQASSGLDRFDTYSFEADPFKVKEQARKELLDKGYTDMTGKLWGAWNDGTDLLLAKGDLSEFKSSTVTANADTVAILSNLRYEVVAGKLETAALAGWVVVQVREPKRSSLFDRLRAWLGI